MAQRTSRTAAAVAAIAIATWAAPAVAVPSQAPPPEVSAAGFDGSDVQTVDCRGNPDDAEPIPGRFVVTRDGDTTDPLAVDVSYSDEQLGLPDPVVIPAGSAAVQVEVPIVPSLVVTLSPSAEYTIASDSQTVDVQVAISVGDLGCNLQGIAEVRQVVPVGQVPSPVDLAAEGIGPTEPPLLDVEGTLPPGSSFQRDGSWTGATSTVGSYRATAFYCDTPTWCPQALTLVVDVVPVDAPPPAAPPAAPVAGQADFTG